MQENRYPRPIYARAVRAYLQEFCDKHDYDIKEVQEHGAPYPLYDFSDELCNISLDDIRLDIDGLDTETGGHITPEAGAIEAWYLSGEAVNYKNWIIWKRL